MAINPPIQQYFGNPVVDWSVFGRDPWPQDYPLFEYAPTDEYGVALDPGVDIYDTYDKAVAAWFNSWLFIKKGNPNGPGFVNTTRPIPIVFASPDRALGRIAAKLCPNEEINFDTPGAVDVIPLPAASLEHTNDVEVDMRRWNNRIVRYGGISYDDREMLQYKFPIPVNVEYQLSIWAKTRKELVAYAVDFLRKFRGVELFIKVVHGNGFGIRAVPILLNRVQQAVELETQGDNRLLRWVFVFTLGGWVPHVPYSVKTVLRFEVDVGVADDLSSGVADQVDATIVVNDVTGEVVPGGGPEATRPLDGPFPED